MKYAERTNVIPFIARKIEASSRPCERNAIVTSMFTPRILAQYSLFASGDLVKDLQEHGITLPDNEHFLSVQRYASDRYNQPGVERTFRNAALLEVNGFARARKYSRRGDAIERLYAMGPPESHEQVVTRLDEGSDDNGELVPIYEEPSLFEPPFAYIDLDASRVGDTTERLRQYNLDLRRPVRPAERELGRPALLLTTKHFVRARY